MGDVYAQDAEGKNKFNRVNGKKPVIRVGNWVEELALWEEAERRRMNGEDEPTAESTIKDIRIDPKSNYSTSNSGYGRTKARHDDNKVAREPKVSVLKEAYVNPYITKRQFDIHLQAAPTGHDILNRDIMARIPYASTTRSDFYLKPTDTVVASQQNDYNDPMTVYKASGFAFKKSSQVGYKRNSIFSKPIDETVGVEKLE